LLPRAPLYLVLVSRGPPSVPPHFSVFMARPPPSPTLFPYTTLFRSRRPTRQRTRRPERLRRRRPARRGSGSPAPRIGPPAPSTSDRKSTRLNSSHVKISYAVFCLKKKNKRTRQHDRTRITSTSSKTT